MTKVMTFTTKKLLMEIFFLREGYDLHMTCIKYCTAAFEYETQMFEQIQHNSTQMNHQTSDYI